MKIYVQRTSKRMLKICPQSDGSVTVIAHRFLSQKNIAKHIADNMPWITSCLENLSKTNPNGLQTSQGTRLSRDTTPMDNFDNQVVRDIFAGKSVILCGQLYKCSASSLSQTHLKEDNLYISEKQFSSRETRLKAIKSFLKRMSNSALSQEVSKLGSQLALCPTKIQFKDLRGRWCSCADAESRAIVLDYRLIQLPQRLQNYVIAHAFAHFHKQGHDESFFKYLSNYLPDYKHSQQQIADYDFLLDV